MISPADETHHARSWHQQEAADEEENDDRDDLFKTNGSQTLIEKFFMITE